MSVEMSARALIVGIVASLVASASSNRTVAQTTVEVNHGETLTIADLMNGSFQGINFELGPTTTFEINDGGRFGAPGTGSIDTTFDFAGSTINVNEGGIYTNCINLDCGIHSNLNLNVFGGLLISTFQPGSGTVANIYGGSIGRLFAHAGSEVNILGGDVGLSLLQSRPGSVLKISGGRFRNFDAQAGSAVTLMGGEFRLNGLAYIQPTVSLNPGDLFSGILSDGSVFLIEPSTNLSYSNIMINTVPLPDVIMNSFVIDGTAELVPNNLRDGQSLTLHGGGELDRLFYARGASMDIQGGRVGDYSRVVETAVTISGGEIGYGFEALQGSTVDVTGGRLGGDTIAGDGSVWNIRGGSHGLFFAAADGSEVNVFGGNFDSGFTTLPGSRVNIHGGTLSGIFGYGGTINLFVKSALVNGVPFDLEFGVPIDVSERGFGSSLEAILADGSPISFDLSPDQGHPPSPFIHPDANLVVTLVPEPQSQHLAALSIAIVCLRYGRRGRSQQ